MIVTMLSAIAQLEGDMMDALGSNSKPNSVTINVSSGQSEKADGHNQLSSKAKAWARKSKMPRRRYIPDGRQGYTTKIKDGYLEIINDAKAKYKEDSDDGV